MQFQGKSQRCYQSLSANVGGMKRADAERFKLYTGLSRHVLYRVLQGVFIYLMETYKWHTIEPHNNNEETMNDYLENHLSDEFEVIFEDGTYAEIKNKNTGAIWGVNASGDGNFTHHKVEFEFVH